MKERISFIVFTSVLLLIPIKGKAQSLKSLFGKAEKVINTVTNTANITGTWIYTGAAVEFETENLLMKAGGNIAANSAEKKLNAQLKKVGISAGKMTFTFNVDSTFTAEVGIKKVSGSYSYDSSTKRINLKFVGLVGINAKTNCTSSNMEMLFKSDKLLKLILFLTQKSNNATLKSISSLADNYEGMMLGLSFSRK